MALLKHLTWFYFDRMVMVAVVVVVRNAIPKIALMAFLYLVGNLEFGLRAASLSGRRAPKDVALLLRTG